MTLAAWLFSAMVAWLPPNPAHVAQLRAYVAIASVVAETTQDPDEALLMVSVASFESGFALRAVGALGEQGPWQLMRPAPTSLKGQAHEALRRIRDSYDRCGTLARFTSGRCDRGTVAAKHREERATRWVQFHPFTPPPET